MHFGFLSPLHFPGFGALSARAIAIVASVKTIVARAINKAFGRTRMLILSFPEVFKQLI